MASNAYAIAPIPCVATTTSPCTVWWTRRRVGSDEKSDRIAYWSRYVAHYLKNGLYKAKGFFAPHIPKAELALMLPDYEVEGHRDSGAVVER